jgi:hypothetical protein
MNQTLELLSLFEYENQEMRGKATNDRSGVDQRLTGGELAARCACEHVGELQEKQERQWRLVR